MITFEQAMVLTSTINCPEVYSDEALRGIYKAVTECPMNGLWVEIGCEYGRSTSMIAQVAKERKPAWIALIDKFVDHPSGDSGAVVASKLVRMLVELDVTFTLHRAPSGTMAVLPDSSIDFLHIDGDHSYACVVSDFVKFARSVSVGGYVCFHDYGCPETPEVKTACDDILDGNPVFERVGLYDTCLVTRRR